MGQTATVRLSRERQGRTVKIRRGPAAVTGVWPHALHCSYVIEGWEGEASQRKPPEARRPSRDGEVAWAYARDDRIPGGVLVDWDPSLYT